MLSDQELVARFGVIDYVIFGIMLAVSAIIGLFFACSGGRQKTANEFLVANHSMGIIPISLSLMASFVAAPGVLGIPAEIYTFGTSFSLVALSFFIAFPISAYLYLPVFYDLRITSSYEYLEMRFNKLTRKLCSGIFILNMVMFLSIATYVPALALSQVTGIHVWTSIIAMGVVCVMYTSVGGIKAVMWTDVFQLLVMFISITIILIRGIIQMGGIVQVWNRAEIGGRLRTFDFDVNPLTRHTVWGLVVGYAFLMISVYGINQTQVQRYLTSSSKRQAQTAVWLNLPGQILFISLSALTGLVLYSSYWQCDPLQSKRVKSSIQILPLFVMESMSDLPGLPGLFVAGLFSSSLSTLSSGLNALAAVTLEDFVRSLIPAAKTLSDVKAGLISKILALVYGILAIALIAIVEQLENIFQAVLTLFGIIGAPTLGLFTLGMMFPCANSIGGIAGLLSSILLTLWIALGAFILKPQIQKLPVSISGCNISSQVALQLMATNSTDDVSGFYKISYTWYSLIGVVTCLLIGLIVSLLTGGLKEKSADTKLLFPLVRRILINLSHRRRRKKYYVGQENLAQEYQSSNVTIIKASEL